MIESRGTTQSVGNPQSNKLDKLPNLSQFRNRQYDLAVFYFSKRILVPRNHYILLKIRDGRGERAEQGNKSNGN